MVDPDVTLSQLAEVRKLVGISRLANITGLDSVGVPTWMAIRPLARSLTVSQGKGVTHTAAKVSAIMEATELFHAEHLLPLGEEFTIIEAAHSDRFVDISFLPIRPNGDLSRTKSITWIPGKCLVTGNVCWVPRQIMDLNFVDSCKENELFTSSSNGLASGNTLAEATIHAICEVIERDHSAYFHIKQQFSPDSQNNRIAPDTIKERTCREVITKVEYAGLNYAVWNITTELGLPCFICVVYDENHNTLYPSRATGAGCHPNRHIAFLRAMTEALQTRLTLVAGARDDIYWRNYLKDIPIDARCNRAWIEERQNELTKVDFEEIANFGSGTNEAQKLIDQILAALESSGFDKVVLTDLTCDQIGVPVVHVLIPGMELYLRSDDYCPGPRMMDLLGDILQS